MAIYAAVCIVIGWRARSQAPGTIHGSLVFMTVGVGWLAPWLGNMIASAGLPAAQLVLATIATPLLVLIFAKPLWTASRYYATTDTAELISKHYNSRALRWIISGYGYAAVCVMAAWILTSLDTPMTPGMGGTTVHDGRAYLNQMGLPHTTPLAVIGLAVFLLVGLIASYGIRAVIRIQAIVFIVGSIALSISMLLSVGGFEGLLEIIQENSARSTTTTGGRGGASYNALLAIPGIFERHEVSDGSLLTIGRTFSLVLTIACLPLLPVISRLFIADRDPRNFAQWLGGADVYLVSALVATFILINGIGGMGSAPDVSSTLRGWLASTKGPLTTILLTLAFIALFHTYAGVIATSSSNSPSVWNKYRTVIIATAIISTIYGLALFAEFKLPIGWVLGLAPQLLVPLAGICWWPWLKRGGVITGLIAGTITVTLTDPQSSSLLANLGLSLVASEPFAIGPALWGLLVNATVAVAHSVMFSAKAQAQKQKTAWNFISRHTAMPEERRHLVLPAYLTLGAWIFFAVGPGAVIGNDIFGAPTLLDGGFEFGWPSLIIWQSAMWVSGALLIWFIARKSGLLYWNRASLDGVDAELQRRGEPNGSE